MRSVTTTNGSASASATATALWPRHVYVGNTATNTITIYDKLARGDAAPVRTIGGRKTGISCLQQFAVDGSGYVYVAIYSTDAVRNATNCRGSGTGGVLVFGPDANGDVAPTRTIAGPATTIANASAIAVDEGGSTYVASETAAGGASVEGTLLRFAAGASGNVAPIASSMPMCANFSAITLDRNEGLITASAPCSSGGVSAGIAYFARDLSSGAQAITWDATGAVGSDAAGHAFLASSTAYGSRIDRYADGTTGAYDVEGLAPAPSLTPGLVSSLAISTCPTAVSVGPERQIYVAGTCPNSIDVFAPDASGTAAPLRTIAGPATQLANPAYVAIGP